MVNKVKKNQKMRSIRIGNKEIKDDSVFFVIEEGQANWGDFDKALRMIDYAFEAGGDAIEFQFAIPEDFYVKDHEYRKVYEKTQFSIEKMIKIIKYAKNKGIEIIVVPLSHNLIKPMVDAGCSAFNLNASDINNPDIINAVSESELPFFISLPLADIEEIDWIITRLNNKGVDNFALLHGQHTMASGEHGVSPEHTSLGFIETLKRKYAKYIGFIDHTPLIWMPACAIAAGANIISKHLCVSRKEKGPDWHICLEPEEMHESIFLARSIQKSINIKNKVLAPGENIDKAIMRRSIVAARDINKGEIIQRNDIVFKRPGSGIEPARYEEIIGKETACNIKEDELLTLNNLL